MSIGEAVKNGENSWVYIIPPDRLIKWYRGRERVFLPSQMITRIVEAVTSAVLEGITAMLHDARKAPADALPSTEARQEPVLRK